MPAAIRNTSRRIEGAPSDLTVVSRIELTEPVVAGRAEVRVPKVLTPFDFVPLDRSSTLITEVVEERSSGPALWLTGRAVRRPRRCVPLKTGR